MARTRLDRGAVQNEPIGALAYLGLARAYTTQAEAASDNHRKELRDEARSAYKNFLDLRKGADQNIPLLTRARAEYDRVN
jgi:eukaryotic-like serine/threonine-protein kinase